MTKAILVKQLNVALLCRLPGFLSEAYNVKEGVSKNHDDKGIRYQHYFDDITCYLCRCISNAVLFDSKR